MLILIDGYNLIAALPTLREYFPQDLEGARNELRDLLRRYKKIRGHSITVVYDGQGGPGRKTQSANVAGIGEVFTDRGLKADEYIIRMARSRPGGMVVVTGDREVESHCTKAGAAVLSPWEFESQIMKAVLLGEKGARKDDEEYLPFKDTRKKGPAKRLKKSQRLKKRRKAKLII